MCNDRLESRKYRGIGDPVISRDISVRGLTSLFTGTSRPSLSRENTKSCRGFTLIELVVTVTIAGILMSIAAPSLFKFLQSNRDTSEINQVVADLSYAHSEAVKRGTNVFLCAASSATACNTAANGNWTAGRLVVTDPTNSGIATVGNVLRSQPQLGGGNTLYVQDSSSTPVMLNAIVFNGSGMNMGAANFPLVVRLCDAKTVSASKQLSIYLTGQVIVAQQYPSGTCP